MKYLKALYFLSCIYGLHQMFFKYVAELPMVKQYMVRLAFRGFLAQWNLDF